MIQPMTDTPSKLIQSAFEQASKSGKPDWYRMTIAVLKNRLLTLTNGQFKETTFGAQTMRDFIKLAGDIVRLDDAGHLPVVVLLGEEPVEMPRESPPRIRVRADLWRAIVDYSSHSTFVWDQEGNRARMKLVTDDLPILPTITEHDLRDWRRSFADRHVAGLGAATINEVKVWQERILSSKVLPRYLAEKWLTELRDKVLTRLRLWFSESGIEEPPDLLQAFDASKFESTTGSDINALRRLAIDCIKIMNEQELSELRFPPGVFLRAMQEKPKRAN
jgi:hypothetical protein